MNPIPTNYTTHEGGEWLSAEGIDLATVVYAAVMFSDGTIWDEVAARRGDNGWRDGGDREPFTTNKPKAGRGRPTSYDPVYCDKVIEYCSQGLSLTAFAGNISVARSTINEWMKNFPEFSEACRIAMARRAETLEVGMFDKDATGPMVTARRFGLVNATVADEPSDWREKTETETTVNAGAGWAEIFPQIVNQTRTITTP